MFATFMCPKCRSNNIVVEVWSYKKYQSRTVGLPLEPSVDSFKYPVSNYVVEEPPSRYKATCQCGHTTEWAD